LSTFPCRRHEFGACIPTFRKDVLRPYLECEIVETRLWKQKTELSARPWTRIINIVHGNIATRYVWNKDNRIEE
jgi:hypothetical protein